MKSYGRLWEHYTDRDTISRCIKKAAIGKLKRKEVKQIINDFDSYVDFIYDYAINFYSKQHNEIQIRDGSSGKKRIIIVPKFEEQVIHHMVVDTLHPLLTKGMYKHTYSSIPGRGLHKCMKKIRIWIKKDPANCKYCLKLDIKKFFNSIDHKILKKRLYKRIKDKKFIKILDEIIDCNERGLPLGFYTSHWLANWLLESVDHYIKEELHIKHYARYMDDMVLFGSNKRKLHKAKEKLEEYLWNELGLTLKENWQLFRFDYIKNGEHKGRVLDFVGFKIYRDRVVLRKSIMLRMTRKIKKIEKKGKFTIYDARQLMSYLGWIDWSDTYKTYVKYVAPYITFKECRNKISQYDKKLNKLKRKLDSI